MFFFSFLLFLGKLHEESNVQLEEFNIEFCDEAGAEQNALPRYAHAFITIRRRIRPEHISIIRSELERAIGIYRYRFAMRTQKFDQQ